MNASNFDAFLSHNSSDKPAVEELASRLEREGFSCWLDKWHLIPGETWQPAIEEALSQSDSCVVFVGPSGFGPWQNEEMQAAINRRVHDAKRRFRVIPVLLPGGQRRERSHLPSFLVSATWVEFSTTLDDEVAFHRLKSGIRGVAPGRAPGEALYEGECPYRGLEAFRAEHARFFFGRDAQVGWLLAKLGEGFGTPAEVRFLGVVGASGSGKSSLALAGLIPAIQSRREDWPVVVFRPGAEPHVELAGALWNEPTTKELVNDPLAFADQLLADERRLHHTIATALHDSPDERRFIVTVDQFEEVFTQCSNEKDRKALIDNLVYASGVAGGKTIVVLTMRADFYGKCANYPRLANAISDQHELVPPLGADELRIAIEEPAHMCGLELEPGLTEMLIQDMRDQPAGSLPLLQHTLLMLWERRKGRRLTVQAYREMGELEAR